jgi:hypothetical protein
VELTDGVQVGPDWIAHGVSAFACQLGGDQRGVDVVGDRASL